jgi:hypothetical protein
LDLAYSIKTGNFNYIYHDDDGMANELNFYSNDIKIDIDFSDSNFVGLLSKSYEEIVDEGFKLVCLDEVIFICNE